MRTRLGRTVVGIAADHVVLDDGETLEASLVVVATGVRPETTLARAAGIECRRGIVVDDQLRTSAPGVSAAGGGAPHPRAVYGLVAPPAHQAPAPGRVRRPGPPPPPRAPPHRTPPG